jgi:chorismate mutase
MAIEIRELKIKGYIDNRKNTQENGSVSTEQLKKLKRQIINECKAEIKKALDRQKRR